MTIIAYLIESTCEIKTVLKYNTAAIKPLRIESQSNIIIHDLHFFITKIRIT